MVSFKRMFKQAQLKWQVRAQRKPLRKREVVRRPSQFRLESLEPRLLLSWDPIGQFDAIVLPSPAFPGNESAVPVIVSNVDNSPANGRIPVDHAIPKNSKANHLPATAESGEVLGKFGTVDGRPKVKFTLTDAFGTQVTFAITGPGVGEVLADGSAFDVVLTGTDPTSSFTITTRGSNGEVALDDIQVNGSLKVLACKTTDLLGNLTITGGVGSVTLDDIAGQHTLTIRGAGPAASLKLGHVSDLSIDSAAPFKSISVIDWQDTNGTPDEIRAPWLGKVISKGDWAPGMVLGGQGAPQGVALGGLTVTGRITGGESAVVGDAGTISAASIGPAWSTSLTGNLKGLSIKGDAGGELRARTIAKVDIKGNLDKAFLVAGLTGLGADGRPGGSGANADTFGPGTIGTFKVGGRVSSFDARVGVDPVDALFDNGNDVLPGGMASFIKAITIGGPMSADSLVVVGVLPKAVTINRVKVNPLADPRFRTTPPDKAAAVIDAGLTNDTGRDKSNGVTFDPGIKGTAIDLKAVTGFRAGFDDTSVESFSDVLADLQPNGSFAFDRTRLEEINGGPLADGDHTLHLRASDAAGNLSSSDLPFALDTAAPAAPTGLSLTDESDTGVPGDKLTNDPTPAVEGQAESGALVRLFEIGVEVGRTTAGSPWQIHIGPLADSYHTLTATAEDMAGNVSAASTPLVMLVDTVAPVIDAALANDSGIEGTAADGNGIRTFRAGFDNAPAGSFFDVFADLQPDGSFAFDRARLEAIAGGPLAAGDHTLHLRATDTAGNLSFFGIPGIG